jgi:Ca2+-binding RTX toxin-like protein
MQSVSERFKGEKPPSGGQSAGLCALCYDVMRVNFLVAGLAIFALLLLLATLPVVAKGGSHPACTITGTPGGDLLEGGNGNDVICGRGGSDIITAHGGNDVVRGGGGADTIYGDQGQDRIYGQKGDDDVYARDSQRDHVYGGMGSDYARVDNPLDVLQSIEST